MNIAVSDPSRKLEGKDLRLERILRITTCDTLMASILPGALGGFSKLHAEMSLEVTTGNIISDLAQRHADVAIRTNDSPPDALIGRRIADVGFAVYPTWGFLIVMPALIQPTSTDGWPRSRAWSNGYRKMAACQRSCNVHCFQWPTLWSPLGKQRWGAWE